MDGPEWTRSGFFFTRLGWVFLHCNQPICGFRSVGGFRFRFDAGTREEQRPIRSTWTGKLGTTQKGIFESRLWVRETFIDDGDDEMIL